MITLYEFDEIPSTNDFLLEKEDVQTPALCIANKQTNGRGQYGRTWLNQTQNALFSLKLSFEQNARIEGLSLVVALSIAQVLHQYYAIENLLIKWPNDIYLDDKKLAGILIENQTKQHLLYSVIGVGINISGSHTFANINRNINIKQLIMRIVDKILININTLTTQGLHTFLPLWQRYDYLVQRGKTIRYNGAHYHSNGIDESGRLLLTNENNNAIISSSQHITIL